jgi:hypothetical protein
VLACYSNNIDNATESNMNKDQVNELIKLLRETESLGLTFDCGTAYIRRGYIDKQTELRDRIDAAVKILEAEAQPATTLPDLPERGYQNADGWRDDAMRDYGRVCALAALNAAPQGPNSEEPAK